MFNLILFGIVIFIVISCFNRLPKKPVRIVQNIDRVSTNPNVIVGESHYKPAIRRLTHKGIYNAKLIPEPTNKYDKNAVKVVVEGLHVGYIGRPYQSKFKGVQDLEVIAFVNVSYPAVAPI